MTHTYDTLMTKTYRELLLGLHKGGNGVPDFNTALHAVSGYPILHDIMSSIYMLHDSLPGLSMTSYVRLADGIRLIGTGGCQSQLSKPKRENQVRLYKISSERKFRYRARHH